jgi:hypothetical protein
MQNKQGPAHPDKKGKQARGRRRGAAQTPAAHRVTAQQAEGRALEPVESWVLRRGRGAAWVTFRLDWDE